ncbi:MAG: cbs domain containing protein [Raineya sp.]|nr:cbs domain containing protein [Raineya sp.]MDW8296154.1 cbs domain containing protein [Raineya sp.]
MAIAVQNIFNPYIRPIREGENTEKALQIMENLHCYTLPCVDENNYYKGLISENTLLDIYQDTIHFENLPLLFSNTFIYENQHWLEAVSLFNEQTTLVAVLDKEGKYQGCITSQDILKQIGQSYAFQELGSILILSVNQWDYSLTEIARLVESNNAKILYLTTQTLPQEPLRLYVLLKINKTELTRIIATFERFGYEIVAKFQQEPVFADTDQERLEMLWKYLSF